MLNNLKYILLFILSLRWECLLPFILQILFFCCHSDWLAGFINPDRWKNAVWLVSPYKCSPLIKLKFYSLSVTLISLPLLALLAREAEFKNCLSAFVCQDSLDQFICSHWTTFLLISRIYDGGFISDTQRDEKPVGPQIVIRLLVRWA